MDFQHRNKTILFFVAGIALLALLLVLFIYFKSNHAVFAPGHRASPSVLWKKFGGTNPPFNFVFEYPGSWKTKEIMLAGKLNMVQALGPQDKTTKFIPGIYLKIKEFKSGDLASRFSETLLEREGQFKGFKKLYEGNTVIGGVNGSRLGYRYILPLPMRSMHPKDTVVRREEALVEKGGKSYQISLWMTEEQHRLYKSVFDHALETFKFLD